jgi:hypothetical protein
MIRKALQKFIILQPLKRPLSLAARVFAVKAISSNIQYTRACSSSTTKCCQSAQLTSGLCSCCKEGGSTEQFQCCQEQEQEIAQYDSELDRIRAVMDKQRDPRIRAQAMRSLEVLAEDGDSEAQYL